MAESDRRGIGYLGLWHFPDSTLCVTRDAADTNPKPEVLKQVNRAKPLGDAEVIVLSYSEEENETLIPLWAIYSGPPHVIPESYHEDPALSPIRNSFLRPLDTHEDDFDVPLWSLPSGSQGPSGFQLFGSDMNVSDALVDMQHGSINCPTSMSGGYTLTTAETGMAFGFAVQADLRHQPDISNGIHNEDWISLRLGDGSSGGGQGDGGGPVESTITNGMNLRQQLSSKEGALDNLPSLDNLADTASSMLNLITILLCHLRLSSSVETYFIYALKPNRTYVEATIRKNLDNPDGAPTSLLLGMNDNNRSAHTSTERSNSPFSFPHQRHSIRP
ncbi:hypothetical protein LguiA_022409 [Lonicera macranthoides]